VSTVRKPWRIKSYPAHIYVAICAMAAIEPFRLLDP